jgi:hypothetical protein
VGIKPRLLTVSVACALDLASFTASCEQCSQSIQSLRAEGKLWDAILLAFLGDAERGTWRRERDRLVRRWQETLRSGGKQVWLTEFAERFSGLFQGSPFSDSGARSWYRGCADDGARDTFEKADYRVTPDGALAAVFEETLPGTYDVTEVIEAINNLERDAPKRLVGFLLYLFSSPAIRGGLLSTVGPHDHKRVKITEQRVAGATHIHTLVVIKDFVNASEDRAVPLSEVAESPELAGILNRAPWYEAYGTRLIPRMRQMEFGYRADELYLVDRSSTLVVGARFYAADTLVLYRHELLLAITHLLSRLALLSEFLKTLRSSTRLWPVRVSDPAATLQATLDARGVLVLIIESLEITGLIRHGFTRLYFDRLLTELAINRAVLRAERWLELAERVALPASIRSSQLSLALESRNNRLQTVGIFIAAVALLVSVALQVLQIVVMR